MKTVIGIIEDVGGWNPWISRFDGHIRVEPPSDGYMPLVIEFVGVGEDHRVSVAHVYTQNGDVMYDPEVVFQIAGPWADAKSWKPLTFKMSNPPIENKADASFCRIWNNNLRRQGYQLQWRTQIHTPPESTELERLWLNFVLLSADEPARLRACDVDRVMLTAWSNLDGGKFDRFRDWLAPRVGTAEAKSEVENWTPSTRY